jgi:hypothetical protein
MNTTNYTLREARATDVERILTFHNTHGEKVLKQRDAECFLESIKERAFFLVERESDKELFGIGGGFQVSENHIFLGAWVDTLKNQGAIRLCSIFLELAALRFCQIKPEVGIIFGDVATTNPFADKVINLIISNGCIQVEPDGVMSAYSESHSYLNNPKIAYFVLPPSSISQLAQRVLERGSQYSATSRHYDEEQIITINVPLVHDVQFLRSVASGGEYHAVA